MNRAVFRISLMFTVFLALAAGSVFAQGSRGMIERKAWYVDGSGKVSAEMVYWVVYLGDYDVKIKRTFPGHGEVTVDAGMNFQFFSAGYIEGNGASARGRVSDLPAMRIRVDGATSEIRIENIDYIYDYGSKVATKDGRKGDFLFQLQAEGPVLEVKRFQLTEFKMQKSPHHGEQELKAANDRVPIIAISFSKDGAERASREAVSD